MRDYNFIWDLDGTLIDSYDVIVGALVEISKETGHPAEFDKVLDTVKKYTVGKFMSDMQREYTVDVSYCVRRYQEITAENLHKIKLIDGVRDTLSALKNSGCRSFVYTHRDESTFPILRNNRIIDFFEDIITIDKSLRPKPCPDGINLIIDRFCLSREKTFYVGDRTIDIDAGENAGVRTILYLPEDSPVEPKGNENYTVKNITEILNLPGLF